MQQGSLQSFGITEWPLGSQVPQAYHSPMAFFLLLLTFCSSFFFCRVRGENKFHRLLFLLFLFFFFFPFSCNNLSQPKGLGSKQSGNTERAKTNLTPWIFRSAPCISIFQCLLSLENTDFFFSDCCISSTFHCFKTSVLEDSLDLWRVLH